jgi:hypothetical protein
LDNATSVHADESLTGLVQIDDTVLKISAILRKARSIKNRLTPINKFPPETLALTATFLVKQRDLVNATAVCQQWRTILVSFPRLWQNPGGSSSELEAYLERSKSVPIEVNLSSPQLVISITPHTSRLVTLTLLVNDSTDFGRIATHLHYPIPTLRSLEILTRNRQLRTLELPSGLRDGLFQHLKKLDLKGISSFRGFQTFPNITELFLRTNPFLKNPTVALLNALGQLPGLEKVYIAFHCGWYTEIDSSSVVTLPCVREMCLYAPDMNTPMKLEAVPPILQFLKLPKVTSLTVQQLTSPFPWGFSTLPVTSFGEHLPNYVELPDLRIRTTATSGEVIFQSPSQAMFTYRTGPLQDFKREARLWGDLPVHSIRKVAAVLADPEFGGEDMWLVDLFGELDSLEILALGGDCGQVLRRLRHRMVRGVMRVDIKSLMVRGGEYAKSQAFKFESVKDSIGLHQMTVTCFLDPKAREGRAPDPGAESSSDDEVWNEDSDENSDEDDEGEENEGEEGNDSEDE